MNERKLRSKIVECGLTIESFSKLLGRNQSTYYRRSKNDTFTIKEVKIMIKLLNLSEDDLMAIFFTDDVA